MSAIYHWISQIVLLILLAIVLELLLPNDSFQKYVKLVIGLVIIVALLSPIMKVLNMPVESIFTEFSAPENDDPIKNSINQYKSEIEKDQAAYKSNIVAVQMKNKVQGELIDQYDLEIIGEIQLELDSDKLQQVSTNYTNPIKHVDVVLGQAKDKSVAEKDSSHDNQDQDNDAGITPVQEVDVQVAVDEQKSESTSEDNTALKDVKQFLAKQWELPEKSLTLQLKGGG